MSHRLPTIASLTDPSALAPTFGRVARVHVEPLAAASSFSGAHLERVVLDTGDGRTRALVRKTAVLARDWLAVLTRDTVGREAAMLDEPALSGIAACYRSAVLAHAIEPGAFGLLMDDLTPDLLPDVRAPLEPAQERALVAAIARLHARFWNDPALATMPWLADARDVVDLLAPPVVARTAFLELAPPAHRERVVTGWEIARRRLPDETFALLAEPAERVLARHADLPQTLLHGDFKVANFALRPDGTVVAFDWAMIGHGACTLDLGWYLAVSASRLTGTKEELVAAYREALERELARAIDEPTWRRLIALGILFGARALLWSKAHALEAGTDAGRAEWEWWSARLLAMRAPIG
jgi:hypothetical protein